MSPQFHKDSSHDKFRKGTASETTGSTVTSTLLTALFPAPSLPADLVHQPPTGDTRSWDVWLGPGSFIIIILGLCATNALNARRFHIKLSLLPSPESWGDLAVGAPNPYREGYSGVQNMFSLVLFFRDVVCRVLKYESADTGMEKHSRRRELYLPRGSICP